MNWIPHAEPEHFRDGHGTAGYDGVWWKWPISRANERLFIIVKAPDHVRAGFAYVSERTSRAVQTRGLSEVERHLGDDVPPRVIELRTGGVEPVVIARD